MKLKYNFKTSHYIITYIHVNISRYTQSGNTQMKTIKQHFKLKLTQTFSIKMKFSKIYMQNSCNKTLKIR